VRPALVLAIALAACARRSPPRRLRPAARVVEAAPSAPSAVVWSTLAPGLRWTQVDPQFDEAPTRLAWSVLRVDLSRWSMRAERSPDGALILPAGARAAVNGGFFEPDGSPSGVLVSAGQTFGRYAARGGSGVLAVRDGRATVDVAAGFPEDFQGDLAVQCGPRLVERGGVIGVHRDDGRRFARTAACVRDDGRTLDLVLTWCVDDAMRGPGLLWLARRLAGPSPTGDPGGCELALNLDGGPSTGLLLEPGAGHDAVGPTPWLLTVRAR
jgi:hypothetical protein